MTKDASRYFVEHAYNQFFQHEPFHSSVCAKKTTKDVGVGAIIHESRKLEAYTWVTNDGRVARMKRREPKTYEMPDAPMDDEEDEDEEDDLRIIHAQVQPDAAEILGLPPQPPQQDEAMGRKEKVEAFRQERYHR